MDKKRPRSRLQRLRDFTWRGPPARWLIGLALLSFVGLAIVLGAGVAGVYQGLQDHQTALQAEIEDHYQKGLAHLAEGRRGLAAAEFEQVLSLDPAHVEASRELRALLAAPTATPAMVPTPLLTLVPPPTLDFETLTRESIYDQAQDAVQAGQWSLASALLEELFNLDPEFRPADVEAMRFGVAYQQGIELAEGSSYEEALRAFDHSLQIRPGDSQASAQRELLSLYINAMESWDEDWPRAAADLQALYDLQPDYADVSGRLSTAETAWADDLADRGRWCQAADHYQAALDVAPSTETGQKQRQAATFCTQPPPTPTPATSQSAQAITTPGSSSGGPYPSPAQGIGHLAFASYAPEFDLWTVYRLALQSGSEALPITEAASQPAISPSGGRVAVRSEQGDQTGLAVLNADGSSRLRLTTFAEDSHPRWSPDGQQIIFDSNREGDRRWRIYRTWAGGGEETDLGFGQWPAWSPDGKSIAFQGCDEQANRCGLWIMNSDGSDRRNLSSVAGDTMPAWSPDGARIAFAASGRGAGWNVYSLAVSSGEVTALTETQGIDVHPVWSPDGTRTAFLSNREGAWAIYVADVGTGRVSKAVVLPNAVPDWQRAQISWGR